MECVLGIEPIEHRIPRFQGKYNYHTDHSENTERPNSPNVIPMSQYCWGVKDLMILRVSEFQCFSGELEKTVGLR